MIRTTVLSQRISSLFREKSRFFPLQVTRSLPLEFDLHDGMELLKDLHIYL